MGQAVEQAVLTSKAPCVVLDIPLLVESPRWRAQLDHVLVVDCRTATQVQRVQDRNGWDMATIESILQNQSPRERRLAAADFVIFNDGIALAELQDEVDQLARQFGL